jgi:hypothetical protein
LAGTLSASKTKVAQVITQIDNYKNPFWVQAKVKIADITLITQYYDNFELHATSLTTLRKVFWPS